VHLSSPHGIDTQLFRLRAGLIRTVPFLHLGSKLSNNHKGPDSFAPLLILQEVQNYFYLTKPWYHNQIRINELVVEVV